MPISLLKLYVLLLFPMFTCSSSLSNVYTADVGAWVGKQDQLKLYHWISEMKQRKQGCMLVEEQSVSWG
jgi:hypothetical protein